MKSSDIQSILLLLLCASSLLFIGFSHDVDSEYEDRLPPQFSSAKSANTCAVPQRSCASECKRRCSKTSHLNNCLLFCNKCCNKCLCVPPGTFGNKECCSCYNDWKTKEGGPKCP